MIVKIYDYSKGEKYERGHIVADKFDAEHFFDLCNWSAWAETKPTELHSNICACGHGICFLNPNTHKYWLAKSVGWFIAPNQREIQSYVNQNKNSLFWT